MLGETNMTPEEINIVKNSWRQVQPVSQMAGELFYDRLMEIKPETNVLFSQNHVEQVKALMETLSIVIDKLDDPYSIIPVYQSMGKTTVGYGVLESDYQSSQSALEWTLEYGLGLEFTSEVRYAWSQAFQLMYSMLHDDQIQLH